MALELTNKTKRIVLPSAILFELEEAFNFPYFLNIPVGVTLNDTLIVNFLNGKRVWDFRARMSDCFRIRYHRFHKSFSGVKKLGGYKGRMVFTWLFDRQDLKNLVFPIVSNYANSASLVVGSFSSMREKVPEQTEFISWADFPKIDMKAWRVEFDRCEPIWRQRLIDVLERHSIPECIVDFLIINLQVQTQNIMSAIRFINEVQPTAIVTEYDRNAHSSCLILAAKKKGVPAITMIHGAAIIPPPRYGFVPVLADYVCCWGDRHKENFIQHGASSEQLVITGCQGLTRGMAASKTSGFSSAMLPVGKTAVLLATSPIELEERIAYASAFCDAMSKMPEITAIIKLHPAETVAEYQELVNLYPNVFFMSNADMPRDVALSVADVVVVHESSFGIDALLKEKVAVVLDVLSDTTSTPLIIGTEMIEVAGCQVAKSARDLESVIRNILEDDSLRRELLAKAEKYSLRYCHDYGQDAAKNVCSVISHAIESQKLTDVKG